MSETVNMAFALQVTAVSMGIVFATLILISLLLDVMHIVIKTTDRPIGEPVVQASTDDVTVSGEQVYLDEDDEELAVAMAAAVNLVSEGNRSRVVIKSFRRIR